MSSRLFPPGRVVGGRYQVDSVIGEGGQGVVYLAHEPAAPGALGRAVALKAIHRHLCGDPLIFRRFQREAAILKRLDGAHVARLLDVIEEDGLLILALEHVAGPSLEALIAERSLLPLGEAVEITLQICAALGAAHAAGVVHRDLKPANVLLEGSLVRVVDFGLGKVVRGQVSTGLTEQDMIFGSPEYMAPEQARGEEADARSDLYAAGVILYQMVVGHVPFTGRTIMAILTAQLTDEPARPRAERPDRGISPALEAVILRSLAKDRDARYPSARAFAEALVAAGAAPTVVAPSPVDDPEALAHRDTELHVEAPAVVTAPRAAPSEPSLSTASPPAPLRAADEAQPRSVGLASLDPEGRPRRWLWTLVALVAALAGVAIGAVVGAR